MKKQIIIKIRRWYLNESKANTDAVRISKKSGIPHHVVATNNNGGPDYYYVINEQDIFVRLIPQSTSRSTTKFCKLVHSGRLIEDASIYRVAAFLKSKRVLDKEAEEYLQGHRTPQEYWKGQINNKMEAARISHQLCDEPGKAGHDARQEIRHDIHLFISQKNKTT